MPREIVTNAGRTVPATIVGYDHETGFGLLRTHRAAEDQAAAVRQIGRRQGAGSGAGGELRRRRHGAAGARGEPPRVRRKLGVSGRGRDLHHAAASGLERRRADQPRGQAGRRRLADRRRRQRRERAEPRQHVRADRPADADHGRPACRTAASPGRAGPGSASTRRRCRAGWSSAASRREVRRRRPGSSAATSSSASTARRPRTLAEFYRKLWAIGAAGVTVPLDVRSGGERAPRRRAVGEPARHLKLKSTF